MVRWPGRHRPRGGESSTNTHRAAADATSQGDAIGRKRAHVSRGRWGTIRPIDTIPVDKLGLNSHAREKRADDDVTDANLRAMVESAKGSSLLIQRVTRSGITASRTNPDPTNLIFNVVLKDGSHVGVTVDSNQANGKSEPGSERTAAGQTIPKQASELSGTWTNNGGDNLASMVALIQRLGGTGATRGLRARAAQSPQSCAWLSAAR